MKKQSSIFPYCNVDIIGQVSFWQSLYDRIVLRTINKQTQSLMGDFYSKNGSDEREGCMGLYLRDYSKAVQNPEKI